MGVYAATKNAVRTATEALSQKSRHLRVMEVSPGYVATDFASSITDPEVLARIESRQAAFANPDRGDQTTRGRGDRQPSSGRPRRTGAGRKHIHENVADRPRPEVSIGIERGLWRTFGADRRLSHAGWTIRARRRSTLPRPYI